MSMNIEAMSLLLCNENRDLIFDVQFLKNKNVFLIHLNNLVLAYVGNSILKLGLLVKQINISESDLREVLSVQYKFNLSIVLKILKQLDITLTLEEENELQRFI